MLTKLQQDELNTKFPVAAAFIRECELSNEYDVLKKTESLNTWQKRRFKELDDLFFPPIPGSITLT